MGNSKRIAVYLRVSTTDQSTELQKKEILDFLCARGWAHYHIYEGNGKTGTNGNRPALKQLLQDARQRKIDLVICWKLDRLFRSLKDLVVTLQEFQDLGVEFISLKDNIDLTTASGRLLMQIIGAMAEFEAALIRERVRAGLNAAKAQGKRLGRPRSRNDAIILSLHSNGLTVKDIARQLGISRASTYRAFSKTPLKIEGILK